MRTNKIRFFAAMVFLCLTAASARPQQLTGRIEKVIVYRGQALVTRHLDVELPVGASEVIVTDLPGRIIADSLHARTDAPVSILSVRYREKPIGEDTREEVKQLDQHIEQLKREIYHIERKKGHLDNQWSMFIKLREFTVKAKETDLNNGLLQFKPINDLAKLILEKGENYINQTLDYEDRIADIKKELELLNRKRVQLNAGRNRTVRQAVLYTDTESAQKVSISLNYLVSGANWTPQYNLRADKDNATVLIEYNAVINQISSEDWNEVAMSLSTAEPSMIASPPDLEPLEVTLQHPSVQASGTQQQMRLQKLIQSDLSMVAGELARKRQTESKKGISGQQKLNSLATENQSIILNVRADQARQFQSELEDIARTEGVSVTYKLDGKLTMPSRSDQQLANIATVKTPAEFTLLASPLLTDYVYLQGRIHNQSNTIFLPGEASVFRNGEFVGSADVPLVTRAQKFVSGFGIDSAVKAKRRLLDKQTRIQGGNRIDTYQYRIALSNYHSWPVDLRLLDRLPNAENSSLNIELKEVTPALSTDSEYLSTQRKKGILRWDLRLESETSGENATDVEYTYTMEYDKSMRISTR